MFNKQDKIMAENLARALKKGKFELEGMEVLALAQSLDWLGGLIRKIDENLAMPAIRESIQSVDTVREPEKNKKKKTKRSPLEG